MHQNFCVCECCSTDSCCSSCLHAKGQPAMTYICQFLKHPSVKNDVRTTCMSTKASSVGFCCRLPHLILLHPYLITHLQSHATCEPHVAPILLYTTQSAMSQTRSNHTCCFKIPLFHHVPLVHLNHPARQQPAGQKQCLRLIDCVGLGCRLTSPVCLKRFWQPLSARCWLPCCPHWSSSLATFISSQLVNRALLPNSLHPHLLEPYHPYPRLAHRCAAL